MVEVFSFDDVEAGLVHRLQEVDHGLVPAFIVVFANKAAAPVIGAEGFGLSFWPYLGAPVGDHLQPDPAHHHFLHQRAQLIARN